MFPGWRHDSPWAGDPGKLRRPGIPTSFSRSRRQGLATRFSSLKYFEMNKARHKARQSRLCKVNATPRANCKFPQRIASALPPCQCRTRSAASTALPGIEELGHHASHVGRSLCSVFKQSMHDMIRHEWWDEVCWSHNWPELMSFVFLPKSNTKAHWKGCEAVATVLTSKGLSWFETTKSCDWTPAKHQPTWKACKKWTTSRWVPVISCDILLWSGCTCYLYRLAAHQQWLGRQGDEYCHGLLQITSWDCDQ